MSDLPKSSAEIGAAWLNEVLSEQARGGATVDGVSVEVIGEGVGFLGEVARLTLSYESPTPESTRSIISKMPTTNEGFKHLGLMLGFYQKESGFFKEVASEIKLRIPGCYLNVAENDSDYLLLLEDLAPMRPGNQLASCTLAEAELALAAAAQLHARWWEDPQLEEFASWLPSPGGPYFDILEGAYHGALAPFHEKFGYLMTPEIEALADRAASDYTAMLEAGGGRRPHTFIHGDFRLDNMMFGDRPEDPPFALLDWQLPFKANPMWDVVYFLAGNFDPAWRQANEDELILGYHRSLVEGGVTGYSLDDCRQDYRAAGLILLGYLVTGANDVDLDTLNDRGREVIETMFTRYATAIVDLGSARFLG